MAHHLPPSLPAAPDRLDRCSVVAPLRSMLLSYALVASFTSPTLRLPAAEQWRRATSPQCMAKLYDSDSKAIFVGALACHSPVVRSSLADWPAPWQMATT